MFHLPFGFRPLLITEGSYIVNCFRRLSNWKIWLPWTSPSGEQARLCPLATLKITRIFPTDNSCEDISSFRNRFDGHWGGDRCTTVRKLVAKVSTGSSSPESLLLRVPTCPFRGLKIGQYNIKIRKLQKYREKLVKLTLLWMKLTLNWFDGKILREIKVHIFSHCENGSTRILREIDFGAFTVP